MDVFSKKVRSRIMSCIRSCDTQPELCVRSLLHANGLRFRLHNVSLPGKPDIVLKKHGCVIFVHGCFWHFHRKCGKVRLPKTRKNFWTDKFRKNAVRHRLVVRRLQRLGWNVIVVWECETKSEAKLTAKLCKGLPL